MPTHHTGIYLATFILIFIESLLLFYLALYRLGRKKGTIVSLDIQLLFLLIVYNVSGALEETNDLPSANFQLIYTCRAIEFITPCFFPYYAAKAFKIQTIWFNHRLGKLIFFILPHVLLLSAFIRSGNIVIGETLVILPSLYAFWALYCYTQVSNPCSKQDRLLLLFSFISWTFLPVANLFSMSHLFNILLTNCGFLTLLCIHVKRTIMLTRRTTQQFQEMETRIQQLQEALIERMNDCVKSQPSETSADNFSLFCESFHLSRREKEIAVLVKEGHTYRAIAEQLFISERTVCKHIEHIFEKTSVRSRTELVLKLSTLQVTTS